MNSTPTALYQRNIYLASSWRNPKQPEAVRLLREAGHYVYDFRNPPRGTGFGWPKVNIDAATPLPDYARTITQNPIAQAGFESDFEALELCDTCVLLLPCGRSAHLELGYAAGSGKETLVVLEPDQWEPELMYLMCDRLVLGLENLVTALHQSMPSFNCEVWPRV